jgi:hypothetical protein
VPKSLSGTVHVTVVDDTKNARVDAKSPNQQLRAAVDSKYFPVTVTVSPGVPIELRDGNML